MVVFRSLHLLQTCNNSYSKHKLQTYIALLFSPSKKHTLIKNVTTYQVCAPDYNTQIYYSPISITNVNMYPVRVCVPSSSGYNTHICYPPISIKMYQHDSKKNKK
uniref:Uncharacterized protein n=1 Tax=Arion vulgaris TaxID=1028688 RepID=A0A0B6ZZB0_9EUPU